MAKNPSLRPVNVIQAFPVHILTPLYRYKDLRGIVSDWIEAGALDINIKKPKTSELDEFLFELFGVEARPHDDNEKYYYTTDFNALMYKNQNDFVKYFGEHGLTMFKAKIAKQNK